MLFNTIAVDENNKIICVKNKEKIESWMQFLCKVRECIGDVLDLVVIKGRQLGIVVIVANVFPNAHHGCYCQHLKTSTCQI